MIAIERSQLCQPQVDSTQTLTMIPKSVIFRTSGSAWARYHLCLWGSVFVLAYVFWSPPVDLYPHTCGMPQILILWNYAMSVIASAWCRQLNCQKPLYVLTLVLPLPLTPLLLSHSFVSPWGHFSPVHHNLGPQNSWYLSIVAWCVWRTCNTH